MLTQQDLSPQTQNFGRDIFCPCAFFYADMTGSVTTNFKVCTRFFFSLVHYLMLSGRICQDSSELYARLFWPTCVFLCWRIRSFCEKVFFVCPGVFFDVDVVGCVATNPEIWARFFLLAHVHFFDADVARSVVINSELCVRFFLENLHFLCWRGICHDNSEVCTRFFFFCTCIFL